MYRESVVSSLVFTIHPTGVESNRNKHASDLGRFYKELAIQLGSPIFRRMDLHEID